MARRKDRERGKIKVPVGLEKVLFHAAQDEGFKKRLFADRAQAIAESGIRLRPSEEATLKVIPDASLEVMIAGIVPENPRRRKFMGLVAAAAASLAAGTAATGCDVSAETKHPAVDAGIGPDTDVDGDTDTDSDTDTETDSDAGEDGSPDTDTVDTDEPYVDAGGVRPDNNVDGDCDCRIVGAK